MSKTKISVTLDSHQVREISDRVGEEYDNRSEAVRDLLDKGLEYDDIRRERDRFERHYQQLIDQREEHTDLVE